MILVRHGDGAFNTGTAGWKVVYKSPVQTATATTSEDAQFTAIQVPVSIPRHTPDDWAFMIRIKLVWFQSGTNDVQGWARYAVNYSNWTLDGQYVSWRMGWGPYCPGRQNWGVS